MSIIRENAGVLIFFGYILLSLTLGFGVGYLTGIYDNHAPIVIEQCVN